MPKDDPNFPRPHNHRRPEGQKRKIRAHRHPQIQKEDRSHRLDGAETVFLGNGGRGDEVHRIAHLRGELLQIDDIVDHRRGVGGRQKILRKNPPNRLFALFLDSACVPLRRDSVQKEAINLALGAANDGTPLAIGCPITPQESAESYKGLLSGFKPRGPESVEVAVTDGLAGIDEAICASYPNAKRQRRFAHLLRNACSKARVSDRSEVAEDFAGIARQEDAESGKAALEAFIAKRKGEYPKLAVWSEKAGNVLTFYEFPTGLRRLIYTNSRIESFNKQIKRMLKEQIQFVAEEALEERIVSMFLHYNEDVGKRKVKCWKGIVAYHESK